MTLPKVTHLDRRKEFDLAIVALFAKLTLLAPEIVEAILAGTQPAGVTRAKVMKPFPMEWQRQVFS